MSSKIYIPCPNSQRKVLRNIKSEDLNWGKIKEYYTPTAEFEDWKPLLKKKDQWKESHSAFELARSWEDANPNLPDEINTLFGGSAKLLVATPEHYTPLDGKGGPTWSDVLAFISVDEKECAVAIEGKAKEPFGGGQVKKWLDAGKDPCNREIRLKHVLCELGLSRQYALNLHSQLLNRSAAAVIEAKRFKICRAAMIVHSFSGEGKEFGEFKKLLNALDAKRISPEGLYKSTRPCVPLFLGWANSQCSR